MAIFPGFFRPYSYFARISVSNIPIANTLRLVEIKWPITPPIIEAAREIVVIAINKLANLFFIKIPFIVFCRKFPAYYMYIP